MKQIIKFLIVLFSIIFVISCNDEKDLKLPAIDLNIVGGFPQNCITVYRGESFEYKFKLSDNVRLGSYSIEMHNNFDHHTHSTSPLQCDFEIIKKPVNPFIYISEHPIPSDKNEYIASGVITIPAEVDTGDYHFMIRVTDASGWQTFEGISIKVAARS